MDKNMIHIDDLVRQRLSGSEEQERAGAWMRMRDVLDQKMPVTEPAKGYNWRRMLAAATGLILLASVTAGSYHMYSTRFNNETDKTMASVRKAANSSAVTNSRMVNQQNAIDQFAAKSNDDVTDNSDRNITASVSANRPGRQNNQSALSHAPAAQPLNPNHTTQANTSLSGAAEIEMTNSGDLKNNDLGSHISPVAVNAASALKNMDAERKHDRTNRALVFNNASSGHSVIPAIANQPITTSAHTSSTPASRPGQPVFNSGNNNNSQDIVTKPALPKDTFEQMTVRQRVVINPITRKGKSFMDTISIEDVAVEKKVLDNLLKQQPAVADNLQNVQLNPAASMAMKQSSVANAESSFLVPLSSMKVRTEKTNAWNARSFNEVVRDVKFNLSQVKFYPGLIMGFNSYVMGSNNINGLHLGITGTFTFGDHWSMAAELKYMYRFNNGSSIHDNYEKVVDSSYVGGQKTYLQSKVEHFFKFSNMQSIELPIALRYAIGRINAFGGVNLAYNFKVNVEEVDHVYDSASIVPSINSSFATFNTNPGLKVDDFKSRFSVGYLIGVGYQISPSVQLDLRATQNVWDNASGTGANSVSRQLFRAPSFQFSLGYRFSQRTRIPRAR